VARLSGNGSKRPLLLMAHSDVVPADAASWTAPPFAGLIRNGYIWGRGALDDKSLMAAQLAVFLRLQREKVKLARDVILLSEADEEAGSTGMQWLIRNAWPKIDAEFALNEGGAAFVTRSGIRIWQIQTAEKVPTRVTLTARGAAGHGSLPRADNPVVHLARAVARLADADQPVKLNTTTRAHLRTLSGLPDYAWLVPLLPVLENEPEAYWAAAKVRAMDPELDALLHTSVTPTVLQAGRKVNVIPNIAVAQVDVRRLPTESRAEVLDRLRRIVNDPGVEVMPAPGQIMPATEPSSMHSSLYQTMERIFTSTVPGSKVVPVMQRGGTDGSFLRANGMAVYGVPIFTKDPNGSRAHGNDERIDARDLERGTELLWRIVLASAADR
jgi:acetylornithine deacetylase/succinyl-diaminopimelate desuccinylase-like protein